ncbi:NAD-dependent epimerase/dehydratase family protein [Paraburkholderia hospita]|uniref:NAD-dependent epimerase/dehydratase family protein n=1 Tax=Paraburkholderia hospita TaxID=169430 RepID=UPI0009A8AE46|nr:NAD(P)-dependent oxidoreductase [Paraburkholderia hospita]SKC63686.1 Nucleoside-diphosphate-sugar epimerase [Paraburkholderia hospita]
MKALLTGGAGFIGGNLARELVARRYEVVALGRRACPVEGVKSFEAARLDPETLRAAMGAERFDVVFHLAAAGVHPADRNREELIRANATLPADVVSAARDAGVSSVVLMGSSAEYAGPQAGLLTEDMQLESRKIYGASKAAGGLLALATAAECGLPVAVLRAFNVFGPGEAEHRLLPSLVAKLTRGEPVSLSLGTQVRDFVYVDDACNGLIAAATALSESRMHSSAYNLSTGIGTSVADFARAVARQMKADPGLLRFGALPMRPDDLPEVVGDPSRLQGATAWRANYSLDEGVTAALRRIGSD